MERRPHRTNPNWRDAICPCGEPFQKTGHASKYCSDQCRRRAANDQREAAIQRWREANPGKQESYARRSNLKKKYGITPEEVDEMLEEQGGKCAICGGDPDGRYGILNVDHCHETGRVRKLLCVGCNTGLGAFKDDPEILARAIQYLESQKPAGMASSVT